MKEDLIIGGRVWAIIFLALLLSACNGNSTGLPSSKRVLESVRAAAIDPVTWVPAAGAVAFGISGLDDNVTDWASDKTPLFGSRDRAIDASDRLRDLLKLGMAGTAMFAPVKGAYREFPERRLAANYLAIRSSEKTVKELKDLVGRERPDGSNKLSFPSGHTIEAVTAATLIRRNLSPAIQPPLFRTSFDAAIMGAGVLTGWARMEANRHYPSDVLTSVALGNFIAQSFYRALVDDEEAPLVQAEAEPDGFMLTIVTNF